MPGKKKTSGTTPAADTAGKGIIIRMYNSFFGDCFLAGFPADNGETFWMLIDCGVHHKDGRGSARAKQIAEDIAKTTGGHLNLVAVTHLHTDHMDGFGYAKKIFGDKSIITIDELWLAWTEDSENPVVTGLQAEYDKRLKALQTAVSRLQESGHPLALPLRNYIDLELNPLAIASNASTLKDLRTWSVRKPPESGNYRRPGEKPLGLPGVSGVRCYVLGPPEDPKKLGMMEDKADMYGLTGTGEAGAFLSALLSLGGGAGGGDPSFENYPFSPALKLSREAVEKDNKLRPFFEKYYGLSDAGGENWRRIETDWMGAADQLAVNLNNMRNNTSLVLAFELTEPGPSRFLLFVGDAQAGNWKSWPQTSDEYDGWTLTSDDIKRQTVFYKVGHHGSVNATYKKIGLDMMSDELVAMIPVDEKWAEENPPFHHPDKPVVEALMEKTRGRVLRSDRIPTGDALDRPGESHLESEWDKFAAQVDWDRSGGQLWIQYTVR